jgi:hypothetical protein
MGTEPVHSNRRTARAASGSTSAFGAGKWLDRRQMNPIAVRRSTRAERHGMRSATERPRQDVPVLSRSELPRRIAAR